MSHLQEERTMDHAREDGLPPAPALDWANQTLDRIQVALRGLRYGTVTAVVQDGVVVQIERTEKIRVERRAARGAP